MSRRDGSLFMRDVEGRMRKGNRAVRFTKPDRGPVKFVAPARPTKPMGAIVATVPVTPPPIPTPDPTQTPAPTSTPTQTPVQAHVAAPDSATPHTSPAVSAPKTNMVTPEIGRTIDGIVSRRDAKSGDSPIYLDTMKNSEGKISIDNAMPAVASVSAQAPISLKKMSLDSRGKVMIEPPRPKNDPKIVAQALAAENTESSTQIVEPTTQVEQQTHTAKDISHEVSSKQVDSIGSKPKAKKRFIFF